MRCRASIETAVALSMQIDPYGHQELHLDRCPCSGDVGLEFLQARRYFVQLRLTQFRQSSACMRRGERGTAGTQGIHERLDGRCRCPGWCVVYLGPRTLKRNIFIEQARSAENFCAYKLVCVDGKLGVSTGWRASGARSAERMDEPDGAHGIAPSDVAILLSLLRRRCGGGGTSPSEVEHRGALRRPFAHSSAPPQRSSARDP